MSDQTQYKGSFTKFNETIQYGTGVIPTSANILIRGHRTANATAANFLPLVPSNPNLTTPQMFKEMPVPQFQSGKAFVRWAQSMGFAVGYGITQSLFTPTPNTVTVNPDTSVTMSWSSPFPGFSSLINGATVTQVNGGNTATATIGNVSANSTSLLLINVTGTFTTTASCTATYVQPNTSQVLNPQTTDEIVLAGYRTFEAINNKQYTSSINTITPQVYLAWQPPVRTTDNGYLPESTALSIVAPTSAVVLPNGNTALYWTTVPANFGYVPSWQLGATTATMGALTGTIVGYLAGLVSGGIGLEISATGSTESKIFTDETGNNVLVDETGNDELISEGGAIVLGAVTIALDGTYDMYQNLLQPINFTNSLYEMTNAAAVQNPLQQTFWNFLNTGNAGFVGTKGQLYVFGVVSNISTPNNYNAVLTLPIFDGTTAAGARNILASYNYYAPQLNDLPYSAIEESCDWMAMCACQYAPYYTLNSELRTITLPVSSNSNTYVQCNVQGGLSEAILSQGWSVSGVNDNIKLFVYACVTALLYQSGSNLIDYEFYPFTIWQREYYFKTQINVLVNRLQKIYKRQTPKALTALVVGAQNIALSMAGTNPVTGNMAYVNQEMLANYSATTNPALPTNVILATDIAFTPDWVSSTINVNIDSFLNVVAITNG